MENGLLRGVGAGRFTPVRTLAAPSGTNIVNLPNNTNVVNGQSPIANILTMEVGTIGVGGQVENPPNPWVGNGTATASNGQDLTPQNAPLVYDPSAPGALRTSNVGGIVDFKMGLINGVAGLNVVGPQAPTLGQSYPPVTAFPFAALAGPQTLIANLGGSPITWMKNSSWNAVTIGAQVRNNAATLGGYGSQLTITGFHDVINAGQSLYGIYMNSNFGSNNTSPTTFATMAGILGQGQWTPSNAASCTLTNRYGLWISAQENHYGGLAASVSSVITNYAGVNIDIATPTSYAAVGALYGVRVNTLTAASTAAVWGLGVGAFNNYLAGQTTLGTTNVPNNTADIQGSIGINRTPVNDTNYNIAPTDYLIALTINSADRTFTLPSAVGIGNRVYVIKDESGNAAVHNIIISPTGIQTIDGAGSKSISTNYGSIKVYSNGAEWFTAD